jgi:hypothetical protein
MSLNIRPASLAQVAQVKALASAEGISAEIAIPAKWLNEQQKADWSAVRVNACMEDFDTTQSPNSKRLYWRPDWRFSRNVEGSGTFVKR